MPSGARLVVGSTIGRGAGIERRISTGSVAVGTGAGVAGAGGTVAAVGRSLVVGLRLAVGLRLLVDGGNHWGQRCLDLLAWLVDLHVDGVEAQWRGHLVDDLLLVDDRGLDLVDDGIAAHHSRWAAVHMGGWCAGLVHNDWGQGLCGDHLMVVVARWHQQGAEQMLINELG